MIKLFSINSLNNILYIPQYSFKNKVKYKDGHIKLHCCGIMLLYSLKIVTYIGLIKF